MPRKTAPSKAQLSQEYVNSSDDEELERNPAVYEESSTPQGISQNLEHLSSEPTGDGSDHDIIPESPAKLTDRAVSLARVVSESENESEVEASHNTREDLSIAQGSPTAQPKTRPTNAKTKEKISSAKRQASSATNPKHEAATTTAPPKPFRPPRDFAKLYNHRSLIPDEIADLFASDEGKQVFHITAPSSLPASAIKQIDFSTLKTDAPATTHQDQVYHLSESKLPGKGLEILFPSLSKEGRFDKHSSHIKRTYAFGRSSAAKDTLLSSFVNGTWKQNDFLSRPQKGLAQSHRRLRYRHVPFGVFPTPPATDLESSEDQPTFKMPRRGSASPVKNDLPRSSIDKETQRKKKSKHSTSLNKAVEDSEMASHATLKQSAKRRKLDGKDRTSDTPTPSKKQESSQLSEPPSERKKKRKRKELESAGS
ncbi:MAG: hypothetical protein Q9160_000213 [Pyrenula sp. 1 TL-2023]